MTILIILELVISFLSDTDGHMPVFAFVSLHMKAVVLIVQFLLCVYLHKVCVDPI